MSSTYPDQPSNSGPPWPWAVLAGLLALLLLAALTYDRGRWQDFVGDEATYLMQAESLAFDLDLAYGAGDYQRFLEHWRKKPQGLILQSGDDGARLIYGKPFFYALYIAPFVRLAPLKGPFVANALLLAVACLLAAAALSKHVGRAAPLWVAALVFASVTFAFTFWAHADLFLMCLTAIALALAFGEWPSGFPVPQDGTPSGPAGGAQTRSERPPLRSGLGCAPSSNHSANRPEGPGSLALWGLVRWGLVGALLAIVAFSRPLYLPLFVPVLLAVPRPRAKPFAALAGAALAVVLTAGFVHRDLAGSFTPYGATRLGFYRHTGYPDVDFPRSDWPQRVREQSNSAVRPPDVVLREKRTTPSLWAWNGLYFLLGRHVGLVPYFLPVLLAFSGRPRGAARWALLAAVGAAVFAFLLTRPYNFYGGGGTLANRYFLPLYPALWFLPTRSLRPSLVAASTLAAGLFVAGLWVGARAYPVAADGSYRYVSQAARRLLPFETSQSHLRLAGREDLYDDFYLRLLSPELTTGGEGYLRLPGNLDGRLLLGRIAPLAELELQVRAPGAVEVEVRGGRAKRLEGIPRIQRFRLRLDRPRIRHPTWWTSQTVHFYPLTLRFRGVGDRTVSFRLEPPAPDVSETDNDL